MHEELSALPPGLLGGKRALIHNRPMIESVLSVQWNLHEDPKPQTLESCWVSKHIKVLERWTHWGHRNFCPQAHVLPDASLLFIHHWTVSSKVVSWIVNNSTNLLNLKKGMYILQNIASWSEVQNTTWDFFDWNTK